MREIGFNSQRDNMLANGLSGYVQCFTTANWMRMSYYCDAIKADNDKGLADFLKRVEIELGPQIEHVLHPSLYFDVQQKCVTALLNLMGIEGRDVFESGVSMSRLYELLIDRPVTIGTNKIGGLPGGHIILAVDHDVYNDPFGDANTNYLSKNGHAVIYKPEMIKQHFTGNILYWKS